ncbi:MBOAT family protein [Mangrovivirga sp. M17]|uniref:MBOAT family protein n=1 Tax=Mangrovivirga halotolerans TaxID=2993936 RepID=A0ABT3RTU5_9BACT|nr:MBOAT family O-acyltransferase [Mangrovivirga halotolerans]MCX2745205.1 MBOAT family protein [Mangrovivirga halotolerans]
MIFNSLEFAIFLPLIFFLYWFVFNKSLKAQNILLVVSSYVFYGWWDWRFLSLILFSTLVDYSIGLQLRKEEVKTKRKVLLWTSILVNLGFLGFFKYFNFFLDNFKQAFTFFGYQIDGYSLNIILPVGISFYTFQTLSYTIDVYKRKLEPSKDFISFTAFVSFFPQLVAGPIERAVNLLPQFYKKRTFNYTKAVNGLRQILWGLFKKVVIADNCAVVVNKIFANYENYNGSTLILGAVFFAFQIYGDFSGYSDIAIGTSRLFGFDLMKNFNFPYFSRDIAEFWRRWHISLSTWFRDYLYIPLGGSKGGTWMKVRNTFIIFLVSGFWHGANWTFIIWGGLNALYFLPLLLTKRNRKNTDEISKGRILPSVKDSVSILFTFAITVLAWIFFRADTVDHALNYLANILSYDLFSLPQIAPYKTLGLLFVFLTIEWLGRNNNFAIEKFGERWYKPLRWATYYLLIFSIFYFAGDQQEFIYFQF